MSAALATDRMATSDEQFQQLKAVFCTVSKKGPTMGHIDEDFLEQECERLTAEIERLRAAIRDAHALIDNDLVIPWIIAHKLDDVLGISPAHISAL